MASEFIMESCARGYHYYQNIWDPVINEVLMCTQEDSNPHDRYAVAVCKDTRVVGHVARKISTVAVSHFTCSIYNMLKLTPQL